VGKKRGPREVEGTADKEEEIARIMKKGEKGGCPLECEEGIAGSGRGIESLPQRAEKEKKIKKGGSDN